MKVKGHKLTVEDITEGFLKKYDGILVWLRWDYLSMKGYEQDPAVLAVLDKAYELKLKMKKDGYEFLA